MVLAIGVIIAESGNATTVHTYVNGDDSYCGKLRDTSYRKKECVVLEKADPWYLLLLFMADFVLVLSSFTMLLLFADWILFVAPVRAILYNPFPPSLIATLKV